MFIYAFFFLDSLSPKSCSYSCGQGLLSFNCIDLAVMGTV